ncbi:MAG: polyphosphate kinase 1 [Spirochaetales bacterium]|nr:polyphosphate kinase 1 [Spirochaetales bacterium]
MHRKKTKSKARKYPFINKEVSWLSFNERVLQEAEDLRNPIGERIKFLGIYSSNLDEFFRVRVAMVRRFCQMGKMGEDMLREPPEQAMAKIQELLAVQREKFNAIFSSIIKELEGLDIQLVDDSSLTDGERDFVDDYFNREVRNKIFPIMLDARYRLPDLKDKSLYLAVELSQKKKPHLKPKYSIIEIPTKVLPRFVLLPSSGKKRRVVWIDDVVREGLSYIFNDLDKKFDTFRAWNIKVVQDSELSIDDSDLGTSYMNKVTDSLQKRKEGRPVWFLYDESMPEELLRFFMRKLRFRKFDTVTAGGRYHYLRDALGLPKLLDLPCAEKHTPIVHRNFPPGKNIFSAIRHKDSLLYFPYHSFGTIIDLLRTASMDPNVESIKITLYRVADFSSVVNALINARKNRKEVVVVLELQARFDEENNLNWANVLRENDVKVIFGVEGLKVHSKTFVIERWEKGNVVRYGGVGTGNLNENTASLYTDCFLLTADPRITDEVAALFEFFENNYRHRRNRHIVVSPYNFRQRMCELIDDEIEFARQGKRAYIHLKVNNLSDEGMIQKLYEASREGVKVKIIGRGRFSLVTETEGWSENIKGISIVDTYLEHARFFIFRHGGERVTFITSADWLGRNIDRRVEVTCPVYQENLKKQLRDIFDIQWRDNQKARIIDPELRNIYRSSEGEPVRSQNDVYQYLLKETGIREKDES